MSLIFVMHILYTCFICQCKRELFLQENNEDIFVKMRSKIDEGLDVQNSRFKSISIETCLFFAGVVIVMSSSIETTVILLISL